MKMNPVVHFEMPAKNRKRMAEFYTRTFGWQTQDMGKEFGNYMVVMTTESTKKGPKKPGLSTVVFTKEPKKTNIRRSSLPSTTLRKPCSK